MLLCAVIQIGWILNCWGWLGGGCS